MNSELATERAPLKTQPSLAKQSVRPAFLKTVNLKTIEGSRRMNSFKNKIWRDRALMVLIYVLRFISLITRSPFASKFSLLDKNMFRIIGDKAADFNYYLLHDYFKYMKPQPASKVKYFMQRHLYRYCRMKGTWEYLANLNLTLEPESLILLIWNILLLILINMNILYVTVKFAFDFAHYPPEHAQTFEAFFLVIPFYAYILDILLKLNTGFYESGYLVKDRNKIWTNFYHNSFIINFVIVLLASIYMIVMQDSSLYLILLLKAFEIPNILESIIDRVELTTNYWVLYDLVRLIVVILYESHICCCGLYYVGLLDTEKSWIIESDLINDTWIVKYLNTFYWSIITMTTIGYGDMTPQNLIEKGYLIFVAIFSCCTFGYSITCIGQILGQLQSKNHQIRMDLNDLKQYLRIRGYNNKLQIKIIRFFEYIWKDSRNENKLDLQKFQQQLPQHLHNEMMIDLNMKSISKIPFFKDNFNEDFISALASKFSEEKLVPYNTIFQKDDPSSYLYILCDGEIEFYVEIPQGSTHILSIQTICGTDEIFGQQEFLLDQNYDINCRSTKMTRILKISKADFQLIAKKYGYEKYCQLKDLVKFSGRYDEFHLNCVGCNKSTHMLYQCPMLTGFPNKTKIIISYRKNQFQERKYQGRNNLKRRLSSLIFEAQISDTVLYYLLKDPKLSQQISSQYYIQTLRQQQHLQLQQQQQQQQQQNEQKQFNVTFQEQQDEIKEEPRKQSILNIKGRKQSNYIKRLPDFLNGTYINFRSMPESKIKSAMESMSNNSALNSQESGTPDRLTPERQTPDSRAHNKKIIKEPERKPQAKAKTSIFISNQDEMNQYEANRISCDVAKILQIKSINQDVDKSINWEKEKEKSTKLEKKQEEPEKPPQEKHQGKSILRLNSIVNQEKKSSVTYSALENSSISQESESETNSQENQQSNQGINVIQQHYMGKYKDIFEEFDRSQDFIYYMTHMNVTKIIDQLNQYKETQNFTDFMNVNFVKKRRSKRTKLVIKIDD